MPYTYDYFQKSVDYLKEKVDFTPEIAIILGSCLGPFAEEIENPIVVDYKDIPNFLVSTVASHAGKLIFGTVCGRKVVCMSGRFHSYEGYDFEQLVIPIRVFKLLGVQKTIITNAAGAVNTGYRPGDVMIISDHIKLAGHSPLRGPNVEEFGPRFFDVTRMYTPELRKIAVACAEGTGIRSTRACICSSPARSLKRCRNPRRPDSGRGRRGHVHGAGGHCGRPLRHGCAGLHALHQYGGPGCWTSLFPPTRCLAAAATAGPQFSALVKACLARL